MNSEDVKKLLSHLKNFVSPERYERIDALTLNKTNHATIVLENIFQEHNTSAVLRTAEALGVNTIHVIENKHVYKTNTTVDKGASQWVTLKKFSTPDDCLKELKDNGYKVFATTLHEKACTLDQLPIDTKIALVFGTEQSGVSQYILDNADGYVSIPMYGFTESLNVSVAAGICMYDLVTKMHNSETTPWRMSPEEQDLLKLSWLRNTIHGVHEIEKRFWAAHK